MNNALDSAAALNLPTGKYTARLDSMNNLRMDASRKFTACLQDLKSRSTSRLNSLDLPPEYQEPLNQLTTKINTLIDRLNSRIGFEYTLKKGKKKVE